MALNTSPRYQYDAAAAAKAQAALDALKRPSSVYANPNDRYFQGVRRSGAQDAGLADWRRQWAEYDKASADANRTRLNPQKLAEQQIMDATFGQGDAAMDDPRIAAAMDALDPAQSQRNQFAQLSDLQAAQAGAAADMLRDQMGQAGIQLNDPAAQARLRQIETARMQGTNAALAQSQQAGQGAAAQVAQMRLSQMGLANQQYNLGAQMLANKQFNQRHVGLGAQGTVPQPQAQPRQQPQAQAPLWQPPTQAAAKPVAATGNTRIQTPAKPKVQVPTTGTPEFDAWYKKRYGPQATPTRPGMRAPSAWPNADGDYQA